MNRNSWWIILTLYESLEERCDKSSPVSAIFKLGHTFLIKINSVEDCNKQKKSISIVTIKK